MLLSSQLGENTRHFLLWWHYGTYIINSFVILKVLLAGVLHNIPKILIMIIWCYWCIFLKIDPIVIPNIMNRHWAHKCSPKVLTMCIISKASIKRVRRLIRVYSPHKVKCERPSHCSSRAHRITCADAASAITVTGVTAVSPHSYLCSFCVVFATVTLDYNSVIKEKVVSL